MSQPPRNCMTKIEIFFIKTAFPAAGSEYLRKTGSALSTADAGPAAARPPHEKFDIPAGFTIFEGKKHRTWQPFPQAGSTNYSVRRAA